MPLCISSKSPLLTCIEITGVSPKLSSLNFLQASVISFLNVKCFLSSFICVVSMAFIGVGYPNKGTLSSTLASTSSNCSSSKNSMTLSAVLSFGFISSSNCNVLYVALNAIKSCLPIPYFNPERLHNALIIT